MRRPVSIEDPGSLINCAATAIAGAPRNPSDDVACASSDATSRRNSASSPHAPSRKAARSSPCRSRAAWYSASTRAQRLDPLVRDSAFEKTDAESLPNLRPAVSTPTTNRRGGAPPARRVGLADRDRRVAAPTCLTTHLTTDNAAAVQNGCYVYVLKGLMERRSELDSEPLKLVRLPVPPLPQSRRGVPILLTFSPAGGPEPGPALPAAARGPLVS